MPESEPRVSSWPVGLIRNGPPDPEAHDVITAYRARRPPMALLHRARRRSTGTRAVTVTCHGHGDLEVWRNNRSSRRDHPTVTRTIQCCRDSPSVTVALGLNSRLGGPSRAGPVVLRLGPNAIWRSAQIWRPQIRLHRLETFGRDFFRLEASSTTLRTFKKLREARKGFFLLETPDIRNLKHRKQHPRKLF